MDQTAGEAWIALGLEDLVVVAHMSFVYLKKTLPQPLEACLTRVYLTGIRLLNAVKNVRMTRDAVALSLFQMVQTNHLLEAAI